MRILFPSLIFLLLVPLFLIFFYSIVHHKSSKDLQVFVSKDLLPKIVNPSVFKIRFRHFIYRFLCLLFLVIALLGPQWGYQWQEMKTRGLEIIFAIDTSKSMLATDIKPNRLERSKLAIKDILGKLNGNKVGLIAFAGTSFLQCPLTVDYNAFNLVLDGLSTQSIPRGGTVIGEAIRTAEKGFNDAVGTKILILITDGENHEGDPVSDAQRAAKTGIYIYTVGIGNPDGVTVEIRDANGNLTLIKDKDGKPVKTALNEKILQDIAKAGNGAYIKGDSMSLGLEELYQNKLLKLYQGELSNKRQKNYIDRYQLFLFLAILFLFAELFWEIQFKMKKSESRI